MKIDTLIRAIGGTPVEDIQEWSKWWSTRLSIVAAALATITTIYNALPDTLKTSLPDWVSISLGATTAIVTALIPVARGMAQPSLGKE